MPILERFGRSIYAATLQVCDETIHTADGDLGNIAQQPLFNRLIDVLQDQVTITTMDGKKQKYGFFTSRGSEYPSR